jgi:hypothetical protein
VAHIKLELEVFEFEFELDELDADTQQLYEVPLTAHKLEANVRFFVVTPEVLLVQLQFHEETFVNEFVILTHEQF